MAISPHTYGRQIKNKIRNSREFLKFKPSRREVIIGELEGAFKGRPIYGEKSINKVIGPRGSFTRKERYIRGYGRPEEKSRQAQKERKFIRKILEGLMPPATPSKTSPKISKIQPRVSVRPTGGNLQKTKGVSSRVSVRPTRENPFRRGFTNREMPRKK